MKGPLKSSRPGLRIALVLLTLLVVSLTTAATRGAGIARAKPRSHVVCTGQTLGMIARRYNVSIAAICAANRIRRNRPIHPGQKLIIPGRKAKRSSRAQDPRFGKRRSPRKTKRLTARSSRRASARWGRSRRVSAARTKRGNVDQRRDKYAREPAKPGYVVLNGRVARWRGYAVLKDGTIPAAARDGFERSLASWRTGRTERIHGRLIRMLTKVSNHFGGRLIEVVSGFRPPSKEQYTLRSKHNFGRAVDFRIPGVPNQAIRDFCRTLPNVGVGYYPNSTFIHLDIREQSAYWIDFSGPGRAPRYATPSGKDPAQVKSHRYGRVARATVSSQGRQSRTSSGR